MTDDLSSLLTFEGSISTSTPITPSHLIRSHSSSRPIHEIKRIRTHTLNENDYFDQIKKKLSDSIDIILSGNGQLLSSYQSLYKNVEFLCRQQGEASNLSKMLKLKIETYFSLMKTDIVNILSVDDSVEALRQFIQMFGVYERKLAKLAQIFLYLDRTYLLQSRSKLEIVKMGLECFVSEIIAKNPKELSEINELSTRTSLKKVYENVIFAVRDGDNGGELTQLILEFYRILSCLDFSNRIRFGAMIRETTRKQYTILRAKWLTEPNIYLKRSLSSIEMERGLLLNHQPELAEDVSTRVRNKLIFDDFGDLLSRLLAILVESKSSSSLHDLYEMASVDSETSVGIMATIWGQYVVRKVDEVFDQIQSNRDFNLIKELISFYKQMVDVCIQCFEDDKVFSFQLRTSFNKSFAKHSNLIIERVCKYIDFFFKNVHGKSRSGGLTIKENTSDVIDNITVLFEFVNDKKGLLIPLQKDLSKRLIFGRSKDLLLEQDLLKRFVAVIGECEETSSLQTMFQDLEVSKKLTTKFQYGNDNNDSIEFNALILSKNSWPEVSSTTLKLPEELQSLLAGFESMYLSKDKKKLEWCNTLQTITFVAHFELGDKELTMNILQGVILYLFNEFDELSFAQLLELSGLDDKSLKTTLNSLVYGKHQLLLSVDEDFSVVRVNSQFQDNSYKIKVSQLTFKEREKKVQAKIQDRGLEYQSALVRIMKSERQLEYRELVKKCIDVCVNRGDPSVQEIKLEVDRLINNEYIKREPDGKTLVYVP